MILEYFFQLEKELERAKKTYAALNAQLLDELPQLYMMSLDAVRDCVSRLVTAQSSYYNQALNEMFQLLAVSLASHYWKCSLENGQCILDVDNILVKVLY